MNSLTDKEINRASDGIDKALSTATRSNRGEVAFRILSVVRNLNDHIAFKIWKDVRPDQKMDINKVASKFGNVRPYQFIARFDHFLRASVSHFTPSEEGAERLMIKYYRYLLQLKKAVYDRYGMIILRNIDMFLEDLDEQTKDYYQKVATEIEKRLRTPLPKNFDNYYIDKIKPFFVNQEIYYEVALEPADEKPNKFNRITAFTKYDISTDYCAALSFSKTTRKACVLACAWKEVSLLLHILLCVRLEDSIVDSLDIYYTPMTSPRSFITWGMVCDKG